MTSPKWQVVSPALLLAMMALSAAGAAARPVDAAALRKPALLQFTAAGHALGFTAKAVHVAAGSHALRVEFVGATGAAPAAAPAAPSADGMAAPLGRVVYPNLWDGISLTYEAGHGGIFRSTYALAAGADVERIRLRYNSGVAVEADGSLRVPAPTGWMRESAPVAWQERAGRRLPVQVAFHVVGDREVGFTLGAYDRRLPLTIDPLLTWNTFLGRSAATDRGHGIAVDGAGNVYVTGVSEASWGTPVRAFSGLGLMDVFVAKMNAAGVLQWSTFLGSSGIDGGAGIALDAGGNSYVTGRSAASWGTPQRAHAGGHDAFVAKLNPAGVLLWNTFLGSTGSDAGFGIAVDAVGNSCVTGGSSASWDAPERPYAGDVDAFAARLSPSGALQWNTFLGSAGKDGGHGVAFDASGNCFVTGVSAATWGSPGRVHAGSDDAFAAMIDAAGSLQWHTFLGSAGDDSGRAIAVDGSGNCYLTGYSSSGWGAPARAHAGGDDAFAAALDGAGTLLWHTFLGSSGDDSGNGIAVDGSGSSYLTGYSSATWGAPTSPFNGAIETFVARLDPAGALLEQTFLGSYSEDVGIGIALDAGGNSYLTGYSYDGWAWGSPVRALSPGAQDAFAAKVVDQRTNIIATKNDFDGDRRTDIGCYYPAGGNWYGFDSGDGFWQTQFGYAGTLPITGDFDSDGRSDIGCYHPASGSWYVYKSTEGFWQTTFGYAGTIPVVGDFDGDGKSDIGCYHAASGNWYVYKSTEGFWQTTFGYAGTIPVVGDFDGDGKSDIGCYHPDSGSWYVFKSAEGFWQTQFGYAGTLPVVGDFDADGKDDIGCYFPAGGNWYVFRSSAGFWQTTFGYAGTEPVVGDFDGDGSSDLGCYYAPQGAWYVFKSAEGFWETQFGYEGTIPLGGTLR